MTDTLLARLLSSTNDSLLKKVSADPAKYRLQVVYTQVNRDRSNNPSFKNLYYNYDSSVYFYPASMVKLPLAIMALEKIGKMKSAGIDKYTTIVFDSSQTWQRPLYRDSTSEMQVPSIAHFIKKIFLISDNDAYNRLYQFLGQQHIHRRLKELGYPAVRITRQFLGLTQEQNRYTNQVRFLSADGKTLHTQPGAYNGDSLQFGQPTFVAKGYMNRYDSLVNEPMNFTTHNRMTLAELQRMLQTLLFPASVPPKNRYALSEEDYKFLYRYLSQYPSETSYPKYDTTEFYDSYAKFFFRDSTDRIPPGVRVFNKTGWAYGFLTDVSYVVDFNNKIEYMLSATIYVNEDEILNDNKYEYNSVGYPFLRGLGKLIHEYEKSRKRAFAPDLSRFRVEYEKRDPLDTRNSIKEVDN